MANMKATADLVMRVSRTKLLETLQSKGAIALLCQLDSRDPNVHQMKFSALLADGSDTPLNADELEIVYSTLAEDPNDAGSWKGSPPSNHNFGELRYQGKFDFVMFPHSSLGLIPAGDDDYLYFSGAYLDTDKCVFEEGEKYRTLKVEIALSQVISRPYVLVGIKCPPLWIGEKNTIESV